MSDEASRELNPLVQRVGELMRQHQEARFGGEGELPVLTEIVDADAAPGAPPKVDRATVEAIARMLERALLERLMPEVNRVIDERLAGTFTTQLAQAIDGVRAELRATVIQMVREAVAASVVRAVSGREDPTRQP